MFRLLVVDQDLQIIEVALTVVAPGSRDDLLDVWVLPLWLAHRKMVMIKGVGSREVLEVAICALEYSRKYKSSCAIVKVKVKGR